MTIEQAATVQAIAAVAIVGLTLALAATAWIALKTSAKQAEASEQSTLAANRQAEAATQSLTETRRDRHFGNLPMLKVTFDRIDTSVANQVSVVMHLQNRSIAPALNIHVWLTDCTDLYHPNEVRISTPTPVAMIGRDGEFTVPVDLTRFPSGSPSRVLRTDWVYVHVAFEGLLGARLTQEWYWEPHEWEGLQEPVLGHGEKLVLHRVTGTSGAEPDDVNWERGA
jgi:type II secretory pathway pseudopilin PulG